MEQTIAWRPRNSPQRAPDRGPSEAEQPPFPTWPNVLYRIADRVFHEHLAEAAHHCIRGEVWPGDLPTEAALRFRGSDGDMDGHPKVNADNRPRYPGRTEPAGDRQLPREIGQTNRLISQTDVRVGISESLRKTK